MSDFPFIRVPAKSLQPHGPFQLGDLALMPGNDIIFMWEGETIFTFEPMTAMSVTIGTFPTREELDTTHIQNEYGYCIACGDMHSQWPTDLLFHHSNE